MVGTWATSGSGEDIHWTTLATNDIYNDNHTGALLQRMDIRATARDIIAYYSDGTGLKPFSNLFLIL